LIEIVRSTGQANPPKLDYAPRPIERAAAPQHRDAAPANSPDYVRVLGGPAQNSRAPGSARGGPWRVRWQSPAPTPISTVLLAPKRVVVQRVNGWSLFDRDGKPLAQGFPSRGVITLDPSAGVFYTLGNGNTLQAIDLEKGDVRFNIGLGYDESFAWLLFLRSGDRILAAAAEQPTPGPRPSPPTRSVFEVVEAARPPELDPYKFITLDLQQRLVFKEANMLPVASGDMLWAVMPDLLIRTSAAQNIDGAFTAAFKPVSASADEAGWLHLVVATGANSERELWIVTPDGHWAAREAVPAAYGESKIPPAIGYDRRVYLRAALSIAAFSPRGPLLWEYHADATIAGLSATPDGRVVIAAGKNLVALDSNGKAEHLATLPTAASTSPVITADGEILVGVDSGVVCLSSK
jgi:hypothetical protein